MKYWIVSWDCNGVEFFQDITEHHPDRWAENHLFDSIKASRVVRKPMSFDLLALTMRARANTQRHYEIYVFTSEDDITGNDIRDWFMEQPQHFADWVRGNHSYKIWDDRAAKKPAIV